MEDRTRADGVHLVLRQASNLLLRIATLLLLSFSGLLSGCTQQPLNARSSRTTDARVAHEDVRITFITLPAEPPSQWEALVAEFESANPGVQVDVRFQEPPLDWPQQADVILGDWQGRWADAVDQGKLLNLTPLLETEAQTLTTDFYPGILSLYQRYGRIWALPTGVSVEVLAYSTRRFEEAGAYMPVTGATWHDVTDAAQRLGANSSAAQPFFALPDDGMLLDLATGWIVEQANGLYSVSRDGVFPHLDRSEVHDALVAWNRLAAQLAIAPESELVRDRDELLRRVAQGQIGMAMVPLDVARRLAPHYPELAFAAIPAVDPAIQRTLTPSSGVFISARTAHPRAAWRWAEFVSRQRLSNFRYYELPARRTFGEEVGIWGQLPDQLKQVARGTLANLAQYQMPPDDKAARTVYDVLAKVLYTAQRGEPDLMAALQRAQAEAVADIAAWHKVTDFPPRTNFSVAPPPAATDRMVDFYVTGPSEAYEAAARAFEAQYPGWRVRIGFLGLQQPAGCVALPLEQDTLATAIGLGLLRDLEPFMEADSDLGRDRFPAQVLAVTRWQGRTYALPGSLKLPVLYYNIAIFDQMGITRPDASWDVERILAAAADITGTGSDRIGLLPSDRDIPFLLEQQGLDLFTQAKLLQPRFTDPGVLAALERLRSLGNEHLPFPPTMAEVGALANEGLVAMWFSAEAGSKAGENHSQDIASTALRPRAGVGLPLRVTAYGITPNAPEPYICWQWIKYLVQQGITAPGELPAAKIVPGSKTVGQVAGEGLYAAYMESLDQAALEVESGALRDWALWWFYQALNKSRNADLRSALQTAQDKAEAFIACLGPAGENDLDRAVACARQVDPAHPLAQLRRQ